MEVDLAARLRAETRVLHAQAEGTPFMARLIAGRTDRASYCLMLRNLHPLYRALEARAVHLPPRSPVALLFAPGLARLAALEADLTFLQGPDWPQTLPVLPAGSGYARHLEGIGPAQRHLLAAHAYVRYLGDLAGGQQLRGIVARSLQLPEAAGTVFYDFGAAVEVQRLAQAFRQALNHCAEGASQSQEIVAEAQLAFRMHHALFTELEAARTLPGSGTAATAMR